MADESQAGFSPSQTKPCCLPWGHVTVRGGGKVKVRPPPLRFYLYSSADTNTWAELWPHAAALANTGKHLVDVHIWLFSHSGYWDPFHLPISILLNRHLILDPNQRGHVRPWAAGLHAPACGLPLTGSSLFPRVPEQTGVPTSDPDPWAFYHLWVSEELPAAGSMQGSLARGHTSSWDGIPHRGHR